MNSIFEKVYQHFLLSKEDIESIASKHTEVAMLKGYHILKENQVMNDYYLLESGVVRAYVHDLDNEEITTEFFAQDDIVIIPSSIFQRTPSQENLQTITDCKLWKIEFDDFQELFHTIPGFIEWGRLWFTYQLFTIKQRSLDMVTQTATNRYLKLLKEKPQIVQQAPLKQIASYLGITDTSLSRIRKEIVKV